ncbi:MAG: ABC transporter substrate-binding protein [Candidatus Abawacabacteria bacterium]|nr:ABC transporter substrate-binding protein [Candidatus Abawacabacteria bacterium]
MISYKEISHFFPRAERAVLALLLTVALVSSTFLIDKSIFSSARVRSLANTGETLSIAHIGTTESLNSLYCTSSMTVRTACSLAFSGLFSVDPFNHTLKNALANEMSISNDLKTYTVTLQRAQFHDNVAVTSADVVFTYNTLVKDPSYDGPYKGAFNGVKITAQDPNTVVFTLDEANTFFPYNLTIGILPQHILDDVQSINDFLSHPFNRNPIGTGKYKASSIVKDSNTSEIRLTAFNDFFGEKAYIQNIHLTGYSKIEDLKRDMHKFDIAYAENLATETTNNDYTAYDFTLPQYVGLFFNNNSGPLNNKNIRLAIKVGTDRNKVAQLADSLQLVDSPLPEVLTQKITYDLEKAKSLLNTAKVSADTPIEIKLVYRKDPMLEKVATEIAQQWKPLGINCILIGQEFGELQNNFLKPRSYDVLLIGERLGGNIDLYPYFHSSQIKYPGLNFSLYKNVAVDNLLSKIRLTLDNQEQKKLLNQAYDKILEDMPVLPLYTNRDTIFINKRVHNTFLPANPTSPEQLYALISAWYIAEKQIWI